jgi:hypothetical protein
MLHYRDKLIELPVVTGHIRIFPEADPTHLIYEEKNVIVNTVKWLFARLMTNSLEPQFGVWGLALGTGSIDWAPETQPIETPEQTFLFNPLLRKQCSRIRYVDSNLDPVTGLSLQVDFQTVVNATTDNIVGQPIREMGLIGGGTNTVSAPPPPFTVTPTTDMVHAPFFDPDPLSVNHNLDTVILINYKTLPPLPLPPGINLIFSWVLTF